jgi:hypothetical protein
MPSNRILRPGSMPDYIEAPEHRILEAAPAKPTLTPEFIAAFDRMSAFQAKQTYDESQKTDGIFAALVDELTDRRSGNGNR